MNGYFITMTAADFMKGDCDVLRDFSPYANWTERDVLQNLDPSTLISLIHESSYFQKIHPSFSKINCNTKHTTLLQYYQECREFATQSIIKSLYPVDKITVPIQHIDCATENFYILSRVRTKYECPSVTETTQKRTYLSFTLASHLNLSHYPGAVWYSCRTGITSNMIGLILPYDADTRSWARNRQGLGAYRETLLDTEDLTAASLSYKTYSQISIKSKTSLSPNTPVTADCILCIDKIDDTAQHASDKQQLPILVLHPSDHTLCQIHDYCEEHSYYKL